MAVAELLANLLIGYAIVGLLFAIAFVSIGVGRVDHAARDASIGFRLIILPGAAGLWPLLLMRWIRARE